MEQIYKEAAKLKRRIFTIVLMLCLCISSRPVAHAQQEVPLGQENVLMGEAVSGMTVRDSTVPTPMEVYEAMISLKDQEAYKEGSVWTNDEPYSDSKGYYRWKGGTLDGKNIVAVGCVAFAFLLSDEAFGSLPARMYSAGKFAFEDIKPGDILRVNNDAHTMIVLEVNDAGVVVAEGNISTGDHKGKVHWGRAISREEVMYSTSHYITRYPEGYVPPDDPEANVSIASGTLEGGLIWNLTKAGTLSITGKGAMPDFGSTGEQPWRNNSSQVRKVIIGNGVTSIGACAFWECGVLSAEISPSVTTIGNSAFRSSSIISVTIPPAVKTIGDSAFQQCQNLSSVTISEGVEMISQNAFRACTSLPSIVLPASIGEVGAAAFFQCQELKSVTFIPGSKQVKLGDNIFTQCYYLMSVTLPKSVDRIGEGMFQNCLMLAGIEIPKGTESIGASAFASCSALSTVIIPDSVTSIGIAAFASCSVTGIYFTGTEEQWNRVSKIGDTAAALSKVEIHYNYVPPVSSDPDDGDDNDNNSGDNSGNNNSENDNNTGNGDNSGSAGHPGDGVSVGNGGGSGNGGNQTPKQKPFEKGKTFTTGNAVYRVTRAGSEVELTAASFSSTKVVINTVSGTDGVKYKVTSIRSKAMQKNKKVKSLTIGTNVKKIGANAFSGCTKLATVTFGKNTVSIGAGAFKGCRKLGKVTIKSKKLRLVGKQVFKGSKSSLKVKVPSKLWKKYKNILKKAGLKKANCLQKIK